MHDRDSATPAVGAASGSASGDDAQTIVVGGGAVESDPAVEELGRYVVIEEVGRGAMGRVLRAYDPTLQREVALKVVHGRALGDEGTRRLVQEARAMAKLSHPNVVAVYDVELSERGGVVLVMEYVPGVTLRAWLARHPRPWPALVERFVAAGRGLAAAHAAGLLHRDFKPANVLVADAGETVKVTDFGLAKSAADAGEGATSLVGGHVELLDTGDAPLTRADLVLGTPRYMAPEQHRGEALGAATDQYAFCVSLWEALCGAPPFVGADGIAAKHAGPPPWPGVGVPRRIVDAIRRGLAPRPDQRWPDMTALLEALGTDAPARRRRAVFAATAVASAAVVLGAVGVWTGGPQPCSGAADQLVGVWDAPVRARAQAAVLGIGAAFAGPVWENTAVALDDYAARWVEMHTEACQATTVRGEQSSAVMDLRMACLHGAKVELAAVSAVLVSADAKVVPRAHELVRALRPLSRCADVEALQSDVPPPAPDQAQAVEAVRAQVADARAQRAAGRYAAATEQLALATAALETLEYGPIRTEVTLERGVLTELSGDYAASEALLREALASASRWRQIDEMQRAALQLMHVVGTQQQRMDDGLRYRELAEGLAGADPERTARFHDELGALLHLQGKYAEAVVEHRAALSLWIELLGEAHPNVGRARRNLGIALAAQGNYAEALAEHRAALATWQSTLGPDHPAVATAHATVANALEGQGDHEQAEAEFRRGIAVLEAAMGVEHPDVARMRSGLGSVLNARGDHPGATREYRAALDVMVPALGDDHADVARVRQNLSNALHAQGELAAAEAQTRRALPVLERTLGAEHPDVSTVIGSLAAILHEQGRDAEAEVEYRRALALRERVMGPDGRGVAALREGLATVVAARDGAAPR